MFEVDQYWKSQLTNRVVVYTASDGATCGFDFQIGRHYLVYCRSAGTNLVTTICDRTKPINVALPDTEIQELGEGRKIGKPSGKEITDD